MNRNPMPSEDRVILARLRTAEGHLHAIILMIERDRPRDQVLHQLDAVQSALRLAGCALLQLQVERSLVAILQSPYDEERKTDLEKGLALFRLNALMPHLSAFTTEPAAGSASRFIDYEKIK